jgi:glycerol-3-phosphate acyltransferase PlsX
MNIGLDMMGGDYAPIEAVKGIKLLREANPGMDDVQPTLTLFGDEAQIAALLAEHGVDMTGIKKIGSINPRLYSCIVHLLSQCLKFSFKDYFFL